MKAMKTLAATFFVVSLSAPLATSAGDLRAEIGEVSARWTAAYNARDAAALANLYSENAVRLPPDASKRTEGRQAIQKVFQEEFDSGFRNYRGEITNVGGSGNVGWEVGNWALDMHGKDNKVTTFSGNYLAVHQREADGVWRIQVETWNDTPSPSN